MIVYFKRLAKDWVEFSIPKGFDLIDLHKWEKLIFNILLPLFEDKELHLITIAPQKYSFGYHLNQPKDIQVDKKKYLYNFETNFSNAFLLELVESEEFQRGLMKLVNTKSEDVIEFIGEAFFKMSEDFQKININFPFQLVMCECDGRSLIIYKPNMYLLEDEPSIIDFLKKSINFDLEIVFKDNISIE